MSQAIPLVPTSVSTTESPAFSWVLRTLLVAGIVSAAGGAVATALWLGRLEAAAWPRSDPAPAAEAVAKTITTTAGDTSVPDASAVLRRREPEPEAPAPTF